MGVNRGKIFFDNFDHDDFLEHLASILSESRAPCFAWAFMPNHSPLRPGTVTIATVTSNMLLGDAKTRDERGRSIEKTEHRVLNGYRMVYEGPANRRRAGIEAFG